MGGRQRVQPADAQGLLRRLHEYVEGRFDSWPDFERKTRTPHATADRWQRKVAVPDLPQLLRLAKRDPLLDLHHLLTGRRATGWLGVPELEGMLLNVAQATVRLYRQQRKPPRTRGKTPTERKR